MRQSWRLKSYKLSDEYVWGLTLYVPVVCIDTDDHLERIQSRAIFHFESFS